MLGPVFWMEMRTRARRLRQYLGRSIFAAALCAVLAIVISEDGQMSQIFVRALKVRELAQIGFHLFCAYAIAQFLIVVFFAPIYCGGAIAADRERRVLDLLFTTRLNNLELVAAKFLVRWLDLMALVAAGAPVMFLCLLLGGVSWALVLSVLWLTMLTTAFTASVTLLVSIMSRKIVTAVTVSYMLLALWWVACPIVVAMRAGAAPAPPPSFMFLMGLNPLFALVAALDLFPAGMIGGTAIRAAPVYFSIAYGAATLALLVFSVLCVRKLGLWASRERIPQRKAVKRPRAARRVWDNPVAWREVKTTAVHRRMRWPRLLAPILLVMISAPVWVAWLVDLLDGRRAMMSDIHATCGVIPAAAVVGWLLMALQGSVSFSHERDHSTLDALLTTPLSGAYIVLGKFAGVLRSSAFAVVVPLLLIWLMTINQGISLRAALLGSAVVIAVSLLAAAWGVYCSVRNPTSMSAMAKAGGVALALCVGGPLLFGLALSGDWDFITPSMADPPINLSYALFEMWGNQDPYASRQYYYRPQGWLAWDERLVATLVYLVAYGLLTAYFLHASVLWVDRHYRVGVWRRRAGGNKTAAGSHPSPSAS